MFPAFKSGKINTFACPATFELGAFEAATSGTIAASNCNSPSNSKSISLSLKISIASLTFVTDSPSALPIVEYDKNATFGSLIPAVNLAFSAADTAISANCNAVGLGITPASE